MGGGGRLVCRRVGGGGGRGRDVDALVCKGGPDEDELDSRLGHAASAAVSLCRRVGFEIFVTLSEVLSPLSRCNNTGSGCKRIHCS